MSCFLFKHKSTTFNLHNNVPKYMTTAIDKNTHKTCILLFMNNDCKYDTNKYILLSKIELYSDTINLYNTTEYIIYN